jgi:hypothetical protein
MLRIVRIRGRDFELPADGLTLVLLVEDDELAPGRIAFVERSVDMPTIERLPIDDSAPAELQNALHRARLEAERAAWLRAMDSDPVIADFLARSPES